MLGSSEVFLLSLVVIIIGEQIEIDSPDCFTSDDCKNNGTCDKGICKCLDGFNGPNCQNSTGKVFKVYFV